MVTSPVTIARPGASGMTRRLLALFGAMAVLALSLFGGMQHANAAGIQVIVTIQQGSDPASGLNLTIADNGGKLLKAKTDKEGKATFTVAKPGPFDVYFDEKSLPKGFAPANNPETRATVGSVSPQYTAITLTKGATFKAVTPSPRVAAPSSAAASSGAGQAASSGESANFMTLLLPKVATGLTFGLLLALASIGVSLIYGTTGLNNFAHGELVSFGSFMAYLFAAQLTISSSNVANGWIAMVMALITGAAFGYLQDLALWKPLRKRRVGIMQLMIVSIGLSLALRYVFAFVWGPDRLSLPANNSPIFSWAGVNLRYWDIMGSLIAIVLLVAVAYFLNFTKLGKATRAVSDNKALAAATGINVERVIRIVWVMGAALASVSGALIGYYQTLQWNGGALILLLIFASVTLGGLGTTWGAMVGAIIIGLAMDVSTVWIPTPFKYVVALGIMIVILLVRPQGLLGKKQRIG